jgi:hypothetical protein
MISRYLREGALSFALIAFRDLWLIAQSRRGQKTSRARNSDERASTAALRQSARIKEYGLGALRLRPYLREQGC